MNQRRNITKQIATFCLTLALLAFTGAMFAHGGMEHVMGTIVKFDNNVLTVKTAKGDVDVMVNEKTGITNKGQAAQTADLTPGTRVAVEAMKDGQNLVAHTVKLGAAPGKSEHGHPK